MHLDFLPGLLDFVHNLLREWAILEWAGISAGILIQITSQIRANLPAVMLGAASRARTRMQRARVARHGLTS